MAYSSGFHPHPRISYANAAPTGVASEAEYVELALAQRVDPAELVRAVDAALPAGLDIVDAVEAGPGSLADRLEASHWRFVFDAADDRGDIDPAGGAGLVFALDRFAAASSVEVTRVTKSGPKTYDVRSAVVSMNLRRRVVRTRIENAVVGGDHGGEDRGQHRAEDRCDDDGQPPCAILEMVVRHTTPAVRPDDILRALRSVADFTPSTPPLVTRLAQGPLPGGRPPVADPLASDRAVIGTSER